MNESEPIPIWPLRTPPTDEDLERLAWAVMTVQRPLTPAEILNLIVPQGRA